MCVSVPAGKVSLSYSSPFISIVHFRFARAFLAFSFLTLKWMSPLSVRCDFVVLEKFLSETVMQIASSFSVYL